MTDGRNILIQTLACEGKPELNGWEDPRDITAILILPVPRSHTQTILGMLDYWEILVWVFHLKICLHIDLREGGGEGVWWNWWTI